MLGINISVVKGLRLFVQFGELAKVNSRSKCVCVGGRGYVLKEDVFQFTSPMPTGNQIQDHRFL